MTDLITLTGPLVDHQGATPLAGVTVTATPSRAITRTSDGEDALTGASATTDETGTFELDLVHAAGLRYLIQYRVQGKVLRPYVLDCDSWPAGSTVTIADLPPIAGVPPSAVEDLQAWVLAHVAGLDVDPAVIEQAVIDYLTANPVGIPAHNATTGRDAADAHPMASITGLVAALAGKQAAGSYATAAQGAKADTAVQPADLGPYATDADLSGHASDTTAVHGIADTSALVLTTDGRLSDARTPTAHTHDDRYFTESEVTTALAGKANTSHTHDDRYYTEAETDSLLSGKAATSHTHDVGDIDATGTADSTTYLRGDGTWATPAGGGGGVTDHGALSGLGDDDHTQYALADGSRGSFAPPLGTDDNYVTDAEKAKLANTSGTNTGDQTLPTWTTIAGKPAVIAAGATQADARTAIGAGTSNLAIGTTGTTAAAGNDSRIVNAVPASRTVNGKPLSANITLTAGDVGASTFSGAYGDLTGKPTLGTAAAAATGDFATAAQGALAATALQVAAAQPINAQTGTSYTLVAADAGKVVTLDNTGAITLNAPGSVFTAGQQVDVIVLNTGMATVVGTSGATANGTPSLVSRARYSAFTVKWLSATSAIVIGDLA